MFTSRQFVVDAGAAHVAGGIFSAGAGGTLVLEEFALETRTADPSLETGWMARTAEALAAVGELCQRRGPSALAVPGHLTLTKFIKTPAVGPAKRDQVIQFEAAQAIPYPLDAVTWDHLVVSGDDIGIEIMLTAVKREVMENLCAAAESAGFPVKRAAASCLALYHAFRFNYPSLVGPVLVVDVGARSTTVLLAGPGGRFFARTFMLGGNAITAALGEELQLSFSAAEVVKVQLSTGQPVLPESSAAPAALRRAADNFLHRLQLEVVRTAGSFSWRTGAASPVAIYLTGGGSLLAGLGPALAEKFKLPVERYDPLRRVELSERARASGAAAATHLLANLVGLAVPGAAMSGTESGLLPPAVRAAGEFRRRQPVLVGAATLLVLALLPPLWEFRERASGDRAQAAALTAALVPLRAIAERNTANLKRIAAAQKQIAVIRNLVEAKSHWIDFLAELQNGLGRIEDVWLEQLTVLRPPATGPGEALHRAGPSAAPLQLRLSGRLLDTHNPVSKVSRDSYERVKQLLTSFSGTSFITAIENERFDNSQPGLLRFDFTLAVNPQHPL